MLPPSYKLVYKFRTRQTMDTRPVLYILYPTETNVPVIKYQSSKKTWLESSFFGELPIFHRVWWYHVVPVSDVQTSRQYMTILSGLRDKDVFSYVCFPQAHDTYNSSAWNEWSYKARLAEG